MFRENLSRLAIYDVVLVRDLQCYLPTLPIASAFGLVIFSTYYGSPTVNDVTIRSFDDEVSEVQRKRCEIIAHLIIYGALFIMFILIQANIKVINQSINRVMQIFTIRSRLEKLLGISKVCSRTEKIFDLPRQEKINESHQPEVEPTKSGDDFLLVLFCFPSPVKLHEGFIQFFMAANLT